MRSFFSQETVPPKNKLDDDQVTIARDLRMRNQVEEYNVSMAARFDHDWLLELDAKSVF